MACIITSKASNNYSSKGINIMLALTEKIRKDGLESLTEFNIGMRRHSIYPNLILFKYLSITADFSLDFVKQARGIILDEDNDWAVVSYPFNKFFNAGESRADIIDWPSAVVEEKLDGSLIQVYTYRNQIQVGTSGTPDASGEVDYSGITFRDLFMDVLLSACGKIGIDSYESLFDPFYTYIFELRTPKNRIVVPVTKSTVTLIGMRNLISLQEVVPGKTLMDKMPFDLPKVFPLNDLHGILEAAEALDPMEQEGYVVKDRYSQRIKVKSPEYVALHYLRSYNTPKSALGIIRGGEMDEVLAHFPEYTELFSEVSGKYESLICETDSAYTLFKDVDTQKEFALSISDLKCKGALFHMRKYGECSSRKFYSEMNIASLMGLMGVA